jgi:hypothetical protein
MSVLRRTARSSTAKPASSAARASCRSGSVRRTGLVAPGIGSKSKISVERAFNKLARTFATQVEALKRYRNGGEQTVRVEQVTVNEGGQAIVGNVVSKGVGASEKGEPTS